MEQVSVKEMHNNLRRLLDRVEAGEEIVITRWGKQVARLVLPRPADKHFPDLNDFRAAIEVKGEPLSETVIRQRREARY